MESPKRYILDKTVKGFINVPSIFQKRHGQTDKG